MTLSVDHQALVSLAENWCEQHNDPDKYFILVDTHSIGFNQLPPTISGFRPDLVWMYSDGKYHYIGEAKTRNDIKNNHTRNQLSSFLHELETQDKGTLVVAVPWGLEGTTASLMSSLQRKLNCKERRWVVISNAPKK